MMIRRNFIFQSPVFNTTESKDYFINECCFGDDLARWFIERLKARGIHTESKPGQEDFGWYMTFRVGDTDYDLVIAYRPGDKGQLGDWMCTVERSAGLVGSLFGARKRGIAPDALETLHSVLSTASEISNLRWFTDKDYQGEENGQTTPTAGR
jgi:hypothetical protein